MSEPLGEAEETSWNIFFNRFDSEIYPVLFESRGYSKEGAMLIWTLNRYGNDLADILEELKNRF